MLLVAAAHCGAQHQWRTLVKILNPLYDGPKTRDLDWALVWDFQVPS